MVDFNRQLDTICGLDQVGVGGFFLVGLADIERPTLNVGDIS